MADVDSHNIRPCIATRSFSPAVGHIVQRLIRLSMHRYFILASAGNVFGIVVFVSARPISALINSPFNAVGEKTTTDLVHSCAELISHSVVPELSTRMFSELQIVLFFGQTTI